MRIRMSFARLGALLVLSLALSLASASAASAGAVQALPGCTANTLAANDDGSTGAVPLPFTVDFFGDEYAQLYVNNNGNVTFDQSMGTYTPFDFTISGIPMIAPFLADVDTRGAGSSVVTLRRDHGRRQGRVLRQLGRRGLLQRPGRQAEQLPAPAGRADHAGRLRHRHQLRQGAVGDRQRQRRVGRLRRYPRGGRLGQRRRRALRPAPGLVRLDGAARLERVDRTHPRDARRRQHPAGPVRLRGAERRRFGSGARGSGRARRWWRRGQRAGRDLPGRGRALPGEEHEPGGHVPGHRPGERGRTTITAHPPAELGRDRRPRLRSRWPAAISSPRS